MKQFIQRLSSKKNVFSSGNYWENRYAGGGNSGDGSYGRLAEFKASVINDFITKNGVQSAIEFGCGDGHQLSLINYPQYLGLDVSGSIIRSCSEKFKDDLSKSFMLYDSRSFFNYGFLKADLTLSLDVIYHITEEGIYTKYLQDLFSASNQFVIIFSTNFYKEETTHVLHREFLEFIQHHIPSFELAEKINNPYPGTAEQQSEADFYIFSKNKTGV